jgi:hypothetical protein
MNSLASGPRSEPMLPFETQTRTWAAARKLQIQCGSDQNKPTTNIDGMDPSMFLFVDYEVDRLFLIEVLTKILFI